jgi:hypothetical protein
MELTAGEKAPTRRSRGGFRSEAAHGVIVCTKVGEPQWEGKEHSLVETMNEWRTAEGRKILERRTLHLFGYGECGCLSLTSICTRASVRSCSATPRRVSASAW